MVAESNLHAVGDNQIVVRIEIVPDKNIVSVITPERRSEYHILSHAAEKASKNLPLRLAIIRIELIEFVTDVLAFADLRFIGGIVAALEQTVLRDNRFVFHFSLKSASADPPPLRRSPAGESDNSGRHIPQIRHS